MKAYMTMNVTTRAVNLQRTDDLTAYMNNLFANLNDRLFDLGKLELFCFLLPGSIPPTTDDAFSAYGIAELGDIAKHFCGHELLGDVIGLRQEWAMAKHTLVTRCSTMKLADVVKFMFLNSCRETIPRITLLYEYLLSLSMSSVDCERGF